MFQLCSCKYASVNPKRIPTIIDTVLYIRGCPSNSHYYRQTPIFCALFDRRTIEVHIDFSMTLIEVRFGVWFTGRMIFPIVHRSSHERKTMMAHPRPERWSCGGPKTRWHVGNSARCSILTISTQKVLSKEQVAATSRLGSRSKCLTQQLKLFHQSHGSHVANESVGTVSERKTQSTKTQMSKIQITFCVTTAIIHWLWEIASASPHHVCW